MKTRSKLIIITALAAVLVMSVAGTALAGSVWGMVARPFQGLTLGEGTLASQEMTATTGELTAAEEEQILFMREEEKLARDVYTYLYDLWGAPVFKNIAASEVRHMASVKTLIDDFGLDDPVGADIPGVFVNGELQAVYDQLVAKGSLSLQDAYEVGVTIEELDIADLQDLLAMTDDPEITKVAQNLLKGSRNHLAAFSRLAG